MTARKPIDDPDARTIGRDLVLRAILNQELFDADEIPADVIAQFAFAEIETVTSRVAGETVTLRRLVLTGEWAVTKTA